MPPPQQPYYSAPQGGYNSAPQNPPAGYVQPTSNLDSKGGYYSIADAKNNGPQNNGAYGNI